MTRETGAARQRPVLVVRPPIRVQVWPDRIWPPQRRAWGSTTTMWIRATGLRLDQPEPGVITALVLTQAGDVLCEVGFGVKVDGERHRLCLLLSASDAVMPVDDTELERLREMIARLRR
ncbi:hypothetical protein [Nocardia thailandica]|uniref:hypothetical protein n=1 Tax=Nocardia thailandica TaxID=257275 RepID=UPI0002D29463|nr:hypothetical protein [Nocardia thailandica]